MQLVSLTLLGVLAVLYAWALYNLPTLILGMRRNLGWPSIRRTRTYLEGKDLPHFSLFVAAKDEEKVVGRLLDRLVGIDYPADRYEVVVVEDGSTDRTWEICESYARAYPGRLKCFHRESSNGKPNALNFAMTQARGGIIGVLDADNVPDPKILRVAAEHFRDEDVSAIQGMTIPINAEENTVSRLGSYDEFAWFKVYIMGKQELGLFVPMTGSCGFIRKSVVESVGGWDERSVTEDVELAARLVKHGKKIKYAPDVRSWQEYPTSIRQLVRQRTRWYRGYLETFVHYGSLLGRPNVLRFDAEMTLSGPLILNICLLSYVLAGLSVVFPIESSGLLVLMATMATAATSLTLLICGIALLMYIRPRRLSSLIWVPAVFAYWSLQTLIAFRVLIEYLTRRPQAWTRTPRTGNTTLSV